MGTGRILSDGRLPISGRIPISGRVARPYGISIVGFTSVTTSSTSMTIPMPTGVQAGDFGIFVLRSFGSLTSGHTNWPVIQQGRYKILTTGEPSISLTFGSNGSNAAVLIVLRGVNTANPFHNSNNRTVFSGSSAPSTAITITAPRTGILSILKASSASPGITVTNSPAQYTARSANNQAYVTGLGFIAGPLGGGSTGAPSWTTNQSMNICDHSLVVLNAFNS